MFAYIEGDITFKSPSLLYIASNGLGYEVHITLQTFDKVQHLEKCLLYTHLQIREDAWQLYGFADETERATFRHLISITGVGASIARILLSSLTPAELDRAIMSEDVRALQRVKGVGAKIAQRIILELKGKLQISNSTIAAVQGFIHNTTADDALIALVNLGIHRTAAEAAIGKVQDADMLSIEDLIKQALRAL